MYYNVCPYCGANLDPGERCDCTAMPEKEKPPADAGTSVGGSEKNICAVIHFTASVRKNQWQIAVKG